MYRLSIHGASLTTLINRAQSLPNTLLVVRDSKGGVFGALISEYLRLGEKEKYYGNGTIGVWSFVSGTLKVRRYSVAGMLSGLADRALRSTTRGATRTRTSCSPPRRRSRWAAEAISPSTWCATP